MCAARWAVSNYPMNTEEKNKHTHEGPHYHIRVHTALTALLNSTPLTLTSAEPLHVSYVNPSPQPSSNLQPQPICTKKKKKKNQVWRRINSLPFSSEWGMVVVVVVVVKRVGSPAMPDCWYPWQHKMVCLCLCLWAATAAAAALVIDLSHPISVGIESCRTEPVRKDLKKNCKKTCEIYWTNHLIGASKKL